YSFCFLFFFSSRRRHTRFSRDWSSDVCSSDLGSCRPSLSDGQFTPAREQAPEQRSGILRMLQREHVTTGQGVHLAMRHQTRQIRSEERRVGKECRSRWSAEEEKKRDKIKNRKQ